VGQFFEKLLCRYLKSFARVQAVSLQKGYDEIFCKFAGSPTWQALCQQVFDQYLGQYSFTPVTQINLLVEQLNITSQSYVLELASGTGGLSCYLAKLTGCRLTGVDASPAAVRIANRQAMLQGLSQRVNFEVGILPELPYPDSSFDVVISIDSIYGVPDKTQLFHGCYRVLKPGSCIGFYTLYERKKFHAETPMHTRALYWFPLKPYSFFLEEAGFKNILKMELTKDFVQLTRRWVKAMQENRELLEKELGKKTAEGLLTGDIRIAEALAEEGLVGRALFKAQKPLNG
jgi:ubiquinone/menaquinone biosynthesis C-methylase UbiE